MGGACTFFPKYNAPPPWCISNSTAPIYKKSRGTPYFPPPPRPPVKSCPVTRIFSRIQDTDRPQPVSFRDDSDTSICLNGYIVLVDKKILFQNIYIECLGMSPFDKVFRVRSKEDGRQYACKRTLLRFRGEGDRRRRVAEVAKHEKLPKHKNIVWFYRAWEERQHLYLLTEVCRSSLADLAVQRNSEFTEAEVWDYMVDLLQGINHLHAHELVHMDIKPENIFIGYNGLCKLGDFGLVIDVSQDHDLDAIEGDPRYLAPEIMMGDFGCPADLFSLGMTLLELATDLDLPQQGDVWHQLRQGILPEAASGLSKEFQKILLGLVNTDPRERLTAKAALQLASVRRAVHVKRVKDVARATVLRIKGLCVQMWVWLMFLVQFLWSCSGIGRIWGTSAPTQYQQPHLNSSHNTSQHNHSDITGFSDEEDCDSSILAHPLSDLSSSSQSSISDPHHGHARQLNSTPIAPKFGRLSHAADFNSSPVTKHSFHEEADTPSFLKRRTQSCFAPRTTFSARLNHSLSPHSANSSNIEESPKKSNIKSQDEFPEVPSLNLTSKNLMDMFNAADIQEKD
ncbi:unnamed protein product, partial [Meganyctiphanes norvegica]